MMGENYDFDIQNEKESIKVKTDFVEALKNYDVCIAMEDIDFLFIEIPYKESNVYKMQRSIRTISTEIINNTDVSVIIKNAYSSADKDSICKGIEEGLKNAGYQNLAVAYKDKLRNETATMVKNYFLFAAISVCEQAEKYIEFLEFVLQQLLHKVDVFSDLKNIKNLNLFTAKWKFFGEYAEYFLAKNQLPTAELITLLSATKYEGSESEARIYFSDNNLIKIRTFHGDGAKTRLISKNNCRMIRKLMEISKLDKIYLLAETKPRMIEDPNRQSQQDGIEHIVTQLVALGDNEKESDIYIKFGGFMHWSVIVCGRDILEYYQGEYRLGHNEDDSYENDISYMPDEVRQMLKSLITVLKRQKHGTSVILVSADDKLDYPRIEAERLCNVNRGIRIETASIGKIVNGEWSWEEDQLLSISSIDGALFMDWTGNCYAIGVIVDGIAEQEGNVARGARYNSIVNYVKTKKEGRYIGVIVSEDGMINVDSNFFEEEEVVDL